MRSAIFAALLRRLELTYGGTSKEQSPLYNKQYFFAPVIVKCMEKNLDIMKPQCREEIFSVPRPFVISRFHRTRRTEGFEILLFYDTNCKLVVAALTSKKA